MFNFPPVFIITDQMRAEQAEAREKNDAAKKIIAQEKAIADKEASARRNAISEQRIAEAQLERDAKEAARIISAAAYKAKHDAIVAQKAIDEPAPIVTKVSPQVDNEDSIDLRRADFYRNARRLEDEWESGISYGG